MRTIRDHFSFKGIILNIFWIQRSYIGTVLGKHAICSLNISQLIRYARACSTYEYLSAYTIRPDKFIVWITLSICDSPIFAYLSVYDAPGLAHHSKSLSVYDKTFYQGILIQIVIIYDHVRVLLGFVSSCVLYWEMWPDLIDLRFE